MTAAKKILESLNRPAKRAKPFHFVFALDDSGSMEGGPWDDLIVGVTAFINNRIKYCENEGLPASDLVTIIQYSSHAQGCA